MLGNRDLGEWVGQPVNYYVRAKPHRRKATVIFKSLEEKAYVSPTGQRAKPVNYTIPELKQSITWAALKQATRPYNWVRFRATANLTGGRQMAIYGATELDAEEKLRDLLELSTAEIVTLSISEEKDRDFRVRKNVTRMYPYRLKLLVRRFDPDGSANIDEDGNAYRDINGTIPLWVDEEPLEFTVSFI